MKVYISSTLRFFFERSYEVEVQVQKNTLKDILEQLIKMFPDAEKGLFENN